MSLKDRTKFLNISVQTLLQFVRRFGMANGISLFFNVRYNRVDKLQLNGMQHPISMRAGTVDLNIFRHVIINEDYQINFNFKPAVIIDGGAYIGLSTAYFANRYPDARIIAVEPDEENYAMLVKNTSGYANVTTIHSGLWSENIMIKNRKLDNHHCGNEIEVANEDDPFALRSISLDTILTDFHLDTIDILKLDIEGAEEELFSHNADGWLARTRSLIIEIHDHKKAGCSKAVFEGVIKHGFKFRGVKGENLLFEK